MVIKMFKKLMVTSFIIFLIVGVVSAEDINSTDDAVMINEDNNDDTVNVQAEDIVNDNQKSTVTVKFINAVTGEEYGSQTNTISEGGSWGMGMAKFNNMIANHKTFKSDGYKYTFSYWSGENGIVEDTQRFYCTGEDYTVIFHANYDKELLGRLTFILTDEHGHNGHTMTYNDEADYKFTFKEPVDVEEGYEFLYYENDDTGEIYNPGDFFSMKYSEFQGQDITVKVNAIYEKIVDPTNESSDDTPTNQSSDNPTNESSDDTPISQISDDKNMTENEKFNDIEDNSSKIIKDDVGDNSTLKNESKHIIKDSSNHNTGIPIVGLIVLIIAAILILAYVRRPKS